jgi:predicted GNAT family N-acyltransferase
LIRRGGQIKNKATLERGINNAFLLALMMDGSRVISSAVLKRPLISYRNNIFTEAAVNNSGIYTLELGYIVTRTNFEGNKYCQQLLTTLLPVYGSEKIFATTRKPEIIHILTKYGFQLRGNKYHDDLQLMTKP